MVKILNQTNSIANHFLYEMRHKDIQRDRVKFRGNLKRLGMIMGYEVSKALNYKPSTVSSPLGMAEVALIDRQPVIISILRAAIPFMNGFIEVFDAADVGFVGAFRKEDSEDVVIDLDYLASPLLKGRDVIIVDPMLATGKSIMKSVNDLPAIEEAGHIHIAAAVAAPEGVDFISRTMKYKHTLWVGALDEKLNDKAYIVPGLGDAGDLAFGPKI